MEGYLRPVGPAGARDYVAVIPSVGCVNEVARRIAAEVPDARPMLHHHGCCQLPTDVQIVTDVLTGVCRNPNVAAVVLVSLGCESVTAENIIAAVGTDKPWSWCAFRRWEALQSPSRKVSKPQALGGWPKCRSRRGAVVRPDYRREVRRLRHDVGPGLKHCRRQRSGPPCQGGATVLFGETTEVIGAEHILVRRACNDAVAAQLLSCVDAMEARVNAIGVDMRGGQPTEGNIRGGLTTIEEKSLGAIVKSGSMPIDGVVRYGERPRGPGLYFMDSPGREMEFLTGLASAGCQVMLFSTGIGAPQGFSLAPVLKICGNANTCRVLGEYIDVDVSSIVAGTETVAQAGARVFDSVVRVFSGEQVKAELLGYDSSGVNSNIYTIGPTI